MDVDGILDVGANRGQFSLACQIALPGIPILAFEPIQSEGDTFEYVHRQRDNIQLARTALGERQGDATLHLSRSADSSSLLPIGKRQVEVFPATAEVGVTTVQVHRLDSYVGRIGDRKYQLLKLDVQGFELNVLRGATEMLKRCRFVYAECSEVALYEGQALRPAVNAFLNEHGFVEDRSFNHHYNAGRLIQADYLFKRSSNHSA